MQKIMYNERYGLEQAVIYGIKEMTRRTAYNGELSKPNWGICLEGKDKGKAYLCDGESVVAKSKYAIGEVVSVAQSYKNIEDKLPVPLADNEFEQKQSYHIYGNLPGWNNKMFVKAELMPRRIKITDIKVEQLQDIGDEDCLKEGIVMYKNINDDYVFSFKGGSAFTDAKLAFATLIDKVSGKGTWERNPWVFAYKFELVK